MRKKIIQIILIVCFSIFSTKIQAQESDQIKADAAASGSSHATAVSMVFWGVLLAAGIAVAVVLIESSSSHSD